MTTTSDYLVTFVHKALLGKCIFLLSTWQTHVVILFSPSAVCQLRWNSDAHRQGYFEMLHIEIRELRHFGRHVSRILTSLSKGSSTDSIDLRVGQCVVLLDVLALVWAEIYKASFTSKSAVFASLEKRSLIAQSRWRTLKLKCWRKMSLMKIEAVLF